ncbi:(p)ppGpp synthetase [Dysgonomonas capnocytophagoides]|uniref:(P)ppGpp synthetase n=1 Tax=Dysgonomonas capnocytophagoides TaxID=45254 RepID=A0A4Y8L575_9BACT|nr:RelA/SpoT domain-containing protein [Dysgonomonas capnocytophagoides]TFD97324.1 (p)ppGpp synthetase [Dysgonomonas capnocytophagoides]
MRYSRNQLSKAGEILLTSKSEKEIDDSQILINEWRTDHLSPLESLKEGVTQLLIDNGVNPVLMSQRLKRLNSIQNKLDFNPKMGLGGMQDIGGVRAVLDDMDTLNKVFILLEGKDIGNFKLQRITNYIQEPKASGYRSIHFIYKYSSDTVIYNGLRFELQIRTKLQHSWATALETVDIHTNTPLKSGYGDEDWLEFFKLVSSLFAYKESRPRVQEHQDLELKELMRKYYKHNSEKKNLAMLQAFTVVLSKSSSQTNNDISDYYLLLIDLNKRIVSIDSYIKEDYAKATADYYELEKTIHDYEAIVLVATSSYSLLKGAYPSYFSDIEEFISSLKKVDNNCKQLGLT